VGDTDSHPACSSHNHVTDGVRRRRPQQIAQRHGIVRSYGSNNQSAVGKPPCTAVNPAAENTPYCFRKLPQQKRPPGHPWAFLHHCRVRHPPHPEFRRCVLEGLGAWAHGKRELSCESQDWGQADRLVDGCRTVDFPAFIRRSKILPAHRKNAEGLRDPPRPVSCREIPMKDFGRMFGAQTTRTFSARGPLGP
jgi:hypothetical protein